MIKRTSLTRARAQCLGLHVTHGGGIERTPPRLELRSSPSARLVRVARARFRPDPETLDDDEWPEDASASELFRWLDRRAAKRRTERR